MTLEWPVFRSIFLTTLVLILNVQRRLSDFMDSISSHHDAVQPSGSSHNFTQCESFRVAVWLVSWIVVVPAPRWKYMEKAGFLSLLPHWKYVGKSSGLSSRNKNLNCAWQAESYHRSMVRQCLHARPAGKNWKILYSPLFLSGANGSGGVTGELRVDYFLKRNITIRKVGNTTIPLASNPYPHRPDSWRATSPQWGRDPCGHEQPRRIFLTMKKMYIGVVWWGNHRQKKES